MKKIIAVLMLMGFTIMCLSGCYGYNELGSLGVVVVTGIDLIEKDVYEITVMSVMPIGGTQQVELSSIWIGSASGKTLMEASKNLRKIASKNLTWVQNEIIIIGEEAAKEGLKPILDFLVRNREIRLRNKVLVSTGRAREMLQVPSDVEKSLYSEMKGLIENAEEWSKAYIPTMLDFIKTLTDEYTGSVVGHIGYYTADRHTTSNSREKHMQFEGAGEDQKLSSLTGSAVFRECILKGFLNDDETRGYLWIVNKAKIGAVVVDGLSGEGNLAMETTALQSSVKPVITEDGITMEVKTRIKARLVESTSAEDLLDRAVIEQAEKAFAGIIVKEMKAAVKKAQKQYKADIFGFGDTLYRKEPQTWREIKEDWPELFTEIPVKYDVQVTIIRIGTIKNSIKIDK